MEDYLRNKTMKHFAGHSLSDFFSSNILLVMLMSLKIEIERMRRISDKNMRAYNARDKMQENEEKEKVFYC